MTDLGLINECKQWWWWQHATIDRIRIAVGKSNQAVKSIVKLKSLNVKSGD